MLYEWEPNTDIDSGHGAGWGAGVNRLGIG